jgi:hypothetical protein
MTEFALEPGMLDGLSPEFIFRTHWSHRKAGCIELTLADGRIPGDTPMDAPATVRGVRGKRISMEAKLGRKLEKGETIRLMCGNRFCIRQDHLILDGMLYRNEKK